MSMAQHHGGAPFAFPSVSSSAAAAATTPPPAAAALYFVHGVTPTSLGGTPTWVPVEQHGQSCPLAVLQLGSCASSGRAWWPWVARHSQGKTPGHWVPNHCLRRSSDPPPKPPMSPLSTIQVEPIVMPRSPEELDAAALAHAGIASSTAAEAAVATAKAAKAETAKVTSHPNLTSNPNVSPSP